MLCSAMNFTRFSRKNEIFGAKVLKIFKGLFQKSLEAEARNGSSDISEQIKKTRHCRVFCVCIISWGCPPQTRTQRTFCKKSFGISKTFAKVKWCFRWEILLPTFLIRKVGRCEVLCTPFSERKVCLQHFLHKNTSASETYNCNFSFNGKIRIYFAPQKALF